MADVLLLNSRSRNEEETSPECPLAQKQYFWLDALHPTPPIHEAMAAEIEEILQNDRFINKDTGDVSSGSSRMSAAASHWMSIVVVMMWGTGLLL